MNWVGQPQFSLNYRIEEEVLYPRITEVSVPFTVTSSFDLFHATIPLALILSFAAFAVRPACIGQIGLMVFWVINT